MDSVIIGGGGWSTYNPHEILELVPELDLLVLGEGEETFSELYDEIDKGSKDFEKVNGLCLREKNNNFKFTAPRALISDLDTIPYPYYDLFEAKFISDIHHYHYHQNPLIQKGDCLQFGKEVVLEDVHFALITECLELIYKIFMVKVIEEKVKN